MQVNFHKMSDFIKLSSMILWLIFRIFLDWCDAININEGNCVSIFNIMEGIWWNVCDFSLTHFKPVLFTDEKLPPASKKDQHFLPVFCAMLAAGFIWSQINLAGAHTQCLWPAE